MTKDAEYGFLGMKLFQPTYLKGGITRAERVQALVVQLQH